MGKKRFHAIQILVRRLPRKTLFKIYFVYKFRFSFFRTKGPHCYFGL